MYILIVIATSILQNQINYIAERTVTFSHDGYYSFITRRYSLFNCWQAKGNKHEVWFGVC